MTLVGDPAHEPRAHRAAQARRPRARDRAGRLPQRRAALPQAAPARHLSRRSRAGRRSLAKVAARGGGDGGGAVAARWARQLVAAAALAAHVRRRSRGWWCSARWCTSALLCALGFRAGATSSRQRAVDDAGARTVSPSWWRAEQFDLARACLLIAQDAYPGLDVEGYLGEIERIAATVCAAALRRTPSPSRTRRGAQPVPVRRPRLRGQRRQLLRSAQQLPERGARAAHRHPDHAVGPVPRGRPAHRPGAARACRSRAISWSSSSVKRGTAGARSVHRRRAAVRRPTCAQRPGAGAARRPRRARADLEQYLEPASPRQILARLLRNLKASTCKAGKLEQALAVMNRMLLVVPEAAEELRDRGLSTSGSSASGRRSRTCRTTCGAGPTRPTRRRCTRRWWSCARPRRGCSDALGGAAAARRPRRHAVLCTATSFLARAKPAKIQRFSGAPPFHAGNARRGAEAARHARSRAARPAPGRADDRQFRRRASRPPGDARRGSSKRRDDLRAAGRRC